MKRRKSEKAYEIEQKRIVRKKEITDLDLEGFSLLLGNEVGGLWRGGKEEGMRRVS